MDRDQNWNLKFAESVVVKYAPILWRWLMNESYDGIALSSNISLRKSYDDTGCYFQYILIDFGFGYYVMDFSHIFTLTAPEQIDLGGIISTENNANTILEWLNENQKSYLQLTDELGFLKDKNDNVIFLYGHGMISRVSITDIMVAASETLSTYLTAYHLMEAVFSSDDIRDTYLKIG